MLIAHCLLLIICFFSTTTSYSQKQKIAVLTPLYLDSAFDRQVNYRYDKDFPKFINPGLEFYEGMRLALDSMKKKGLKLELYIYDTRSASRTLQQQIQSMDSNVNLVIAYATAEETQLLAGAAAARMIPFINVNLPNDAGIINNPYFLMLNPTLKTHVEAVHRYLQKHFAAEQVLVFSKKGQLEEMIRKLINDASAKNGAVPLQLSYHDLPVNFTSEQLFSYLDSTRNNIILSATLDDRFNRQLLTQLSLGSKIYRSTVVGMPTLDNLSKDFESLEYRGPEIIYGHPFYHPKTDSVSAAINNYFNTVMYARPSDMVFRGYEVIWKFGHLLLDHRSDLSSNLFFPDYRVFTDFDIQPVINPQTMTLDYFENKKLYFLKWQDGVIKGVD